MSLAAISKHLHILARAGLVEQRRTGRLVVCRLLPDGLRAAGIWLQGVGGFDAEDYDTLEALLTRDAGRSRRRDPDVEPFGYLSLDSSPAVTQDRGNRPQQSDTGRNTHEESRYARGALAAFVAGRRRPGRRPRTGSRRGPINIIVPWGAGGSTDQVTRVTAPIIAEELGVNVVVVNQPGASGAIGTQEVLNAPRDGLTWTANAIANNATYAVSGLLEGTDIDDWHIYLSVANAPLISVPADSEFQDFGQLLEAFRTRGDEITVATAGVTSSGGTAIADARPGRRLRVPHGRLRRRRPGGDRHRRRRGDGHDPARGRADRARPRRPAAAARGDERPAADRRRRRPGAEPVTDWIDMDLAPDYFGIFIPRGVPDEVVATVDKIWADQVMTSDALKSYAETFGAVFAPSFGDEARGHGDADRHPGGLRGGRARRGGQPAERDRGRLRDHVGSDHAVAAATTMSEPGRHRRSSGRARTPPTSLAGLVFVLLGLATLYGAWTMPRLENRGVHPLTAPGLVPGLLALALIALRRPARRRGLARPAASAPASRPLVGICAGPQAAGWRRRFALVLLYTLGLVGWLPFWVATALFVFAFVVAFEVLLALDAAATGAHARLGRRGRARRRGRRGPGLRARLPRPAALRSAAHCSTGFPTSARVSSAY